MQRDTCGMTIWRRHWPIWITSGTSVVAGMLPSENEPSGAVRVDTSAIGGTSFSQRRHEPGPGRGGTSPLGT